MAAQPPSEQQPAEQPPSEQPPAEQPPSEQQPPEQPASSRGLRGGLVARGRRRLTDGQERATGVLARHEHRPLVEVALRIHRRDREAAGTVVGSAVAFRLFLFFVPLLLFLVGLLGIVARWVDPDDVQHRTGVTGSLADQIDAALSQPGSSRWIATILGLSGMATAGRSLSKVMVSASCLAWRLPVRTRPPMRIVGGIVGLVAGIGLVAVIVNRIRADLGLAATGLSFLAVVVVYGLAWVALSMMLPRATNDPGALLPGAVLVAVTIAGMQAVSQFFLPDRIGRASELYGAFGATVVTLGWFFVLGRAAVLGMVLDAVVYERFGTISQVVFALPVVSILPRRSAWIRRFFDLDLDPRTEGARRPGRPTP
ncbi:MAG TPA: YhjD/YihY/BrkB family envelope integrity protein [Acidimicrobiales bacterium]|nr:YhjD/YihY/BrkB family envelope integrity protein [Acidimicrobiales bacterium]